MRTRWKTNPRVRRWAWLMVTVLWFAGPGAASSSGSSAPRTPGWWRSIDAAQEAGTLRVSVETELGDFEVELEGQRAPATVANFLRYVDGGQYDGGRFTRTVTLENQVRPDVLIEVIQAGPNPEFQGRGFPPIPLERTRDTGLRHLDGTISMARGGPDAARASFFICIGDQPSLDFGGARNADGQGYAAFGRVVRGMEVVRCIHRSPANEREQLTPPIRIIRISRID